MQEEYFNWLYRLVCASTRPDSSYYLLMSALHRKEFYSLVPNDDNRETDGKELRDEFRNVMHPELPVDWFEAPCTVLEMIIALSQRMVSVFIGTEKESSYDKWFWEIIENLNLDDLTDDRYIFLNGMYVVDEILTTLLERTYRPDGRGGLFPLKSGMKNLTETEIWYQMQYYSMEKLEGIL